MGPPCQIAAAPLQSECWWHQAARAALLWSVVSTGRAGAARGSPRLGRRVRAQVSTHTLAEAAVPELWGAASAHSSCFFQCWGPADAARCFDKQYEHKGRCCNRCQPGTEPFLFAGTPAPCCSAASPARCDCASSAGSFMSLCHLSARATGDLMGALGDPLDLAKPTAALLGLSVLLRPQDPLARAACGESDSIFQPLLSLPDCFAALRVLEAVKGPPSPPPAALPQPSPLCSMCSLGCQSGIELLSSVAQQPWHPQPPGLLCPAAELLPGEGEHHLAPSSPASFVGEKLVSECNGTEDSVCTHCESGHYQQSWTRERHCAPHDICDDSKCSLCPAALDWGAAGAGIPSGSPASSLTSPTLLLPRHRPRREDERKRDAQHGVPVPGRHTLLRCQLPDLRGEPALPARLRLRGG